MLDVSIPADIECVRDALLRITQTLRCAGIDEAGKDARVLVATATGLQPADLICRPDRVLDEKEHLRLARMVERRRAREPISRILGHREFYGRSFAISPATLDPRPDSETLIEMVLKLAAKEGWRERTFRVLDVGTGTGCLLITILAELPLATGVGTDISPEALKVAAENARRNRVVDRVKLETRRSLKDVDETFDLLICNPPYVASGEIAGLDAEVRAYDPHEALNGGEDSLDVYREIIEGLDRVVPQGWVVFEVGAGQAPRVAELLRTSSAVKRFGGIQMLADLGGHTRCVAMEIQL